MDRGFGSEIIDKRRAAEGSGAWEGGEEGSDEGATAESNQFLIGIHSVSVLFSKQGIKDTLDAKVFPMLIEMA